MDYQQARQIRNMPSLSELIRREAAYGGQGVVGSVKEALKQKFNVKRRLQASMLGVKEKLDPMNWARKLFGRTGAALYGRAFGRSEEDIQYFAGRARPIGGRTYQIGETPKYRGYGPTETAGASGGGGVNKKTISILSDMYNFLKKTQEQETKRRELLANKREEYQLEDERRHKELLDAIRGKEPKATAIPVKSESKTDSGSLFGSFLDGLGWVQTIKDFMSGGIFNTLKGLTSLTSLGPLILGAAPLAALAMITKWAGEADINNPGSNPIANVGAAGLEFSKSANKFLGKDQEIEKRREENRLRGMTPETATPAKPAASNEQQLKALAPAIQQYEKMYKEAKTPEEKKQIEGALNQLYNQRDSLTKQIGGVEVKGARVTATPAPAAAPAAPAPAAAPAAKVSEESAPAPVASKVATLSTEGQNLKLQSKFNTESPTVVNQQNAATSQQTPARNKLPPVRNQEPTFKRMIYESTRVV